MLKKFFVGALIALAGFGGFSISEAHHGDYDCRDGYNRENYCCGNGYYGRGARGNSQDNYGDCCYDGAYCCR